MNCVFMYLFLWTWQILLCCVGGRGCEVSCVGHHQQRGKTITGSALHGAVFHFAQMLDYLVHIMSRSQSFFRFGYFGYVLDDLFMTLTQVHGCDIDKQKFACLQDKVRTTQPITTVLSSYIPLVMLITWLDLGGILLETLFWQIFFENFGCVFSRSNTIGHISGMVGPIDVKRKGGAWVGYWVNYVTLTFDLTHNLDLWFFKVKFQNSCISGTVIWLMWNKKKTNQLGTGLTVWSCPLTTPMTLTL